MTVCDHAHAVAEHKYVCMAVRKRVLRSERGHRERWPSEPAFDNVFPVEYGVRRHACADGSKGATLGLCGCADLIDPGISVRAVAAASISGQYQHSALSFTFPLRIRSSHDERGYRAAAQLLCSHGRTVLWLAVDVRPSVSRINYEQVRRPRAFCG